MNVKIFRASCGSDGNRDKNRTRTRTRTRNRELRTAKTRTAPRGTEFTLKDVEMVENDSKKICRIYI